MDRRVRLLNAHQIAQQQVGAFRPELELRHFRVADFQPVAEIFGQCVAVIIGQDIAQRRGICPPGVFLVDAVAVGTLGGGFSIITTCLLNITTDNTTSSELNPPFLFLISRTPTRVLISTSR